MTIKSGQFVPLTRRTDKYFGVKGFADTLDVASSVESGEIDNPAKGGWRNVAKKEIPMPSPSKPAPFLRKTK